MRKIIHIDMDAFYASVEQRDDPALRGRPIAVGGGGRRGVVAAASYEARPFGVRSAMPGRMAERLCPQLVFVRPRFDVYRRVSQQIRALFHEVTDLVEPLSLDEAYLDVTEPKQGPRSATLLAETLRRRIYEATGLTASAGVSFNKFLAKVASDVDKPDGLTVITPADADAFLEALPIERFHGIGPVTARRLRELGVVTGADLRARSERELTTHFGTRGRVYYRMAHALDDRPVRPHRIRKSIGAERTYETDVRHLRQMEVRLDELAGRVGERLAQYGQAARCVVVKIRYPDFTTLTRQTTCHVPLQDPAALHRLACHLLHTPAPPEHPVRLLGLTAKELIAEHAAGTRQLGLFEEAVGY